MLFDPGTEDARKDTEKQKGNGKKNDFDPVEGVPCGKERGEGMGQDRIDTQNENGFA